MFVNAGSLPKVGKVSKVQSRNESTAAPVPSSPANLRTVVLVGPGGGGKTAVFENLVAARIPGRRPAADDGRSVTLSAAAVESNGVVINLIDTPGYPDFVGELRAGLRAADAAIFVISATEGIDRATSLLWQECAAVGMPRAIVVTKLDVPRTKFADVVATCQQTFGEAQPLFLPLFDGDQVLSGTVGVLSGAVYAVDDKVASHREATAEEAALIEDWHGPVMEAIIEESEDESLLDRYLSGEDIDINNITEDLTTAIGGARFFPIIPVSWASWAGFEAVYWLIEQGFTGPLSRSLPPMVDLHGEPVTLTADPNGPLVAEVIRTTTDPYVGRLSLVRVFSGTLRSDESVRVSGHMSSFLGKEIEGHPDHDGDERVGPLSSPLGDGLRPKSEAIAGDIALIAKLAQAETSDTLSAKDSPVLIEPWVLPEPLLPIAIRAAKKADEDKLAGALQRVVAEDVTMRMEHNPETHQVVLWTMGQAHLDEILGRLASRYGVEVEAVPFRTALRETFLKKITQIGRHVKQSGGHGQYAVCHLEIEPLPRGAGFEFVDKVVGGSVPRNFIPSVEKGARSQLEKGVLAGYPVVDVRVTLFDGKAHSVDSSDMAFQTAAAHALKEAANQSTVGLLEPIDAVQVKVADDYVGAVMSDFRGRRGHVLGTEPAEEGWTLINAEVPQTELSRYPIDLRSITQGTGTFTRQMLRYDYVPSDKVAEFAKQDS